MFFIKEQAMKVLIIEDQELPLEFMSEVLVGQGVVCTVAKWYSQAESMICSEERYDIVFLDHRMPLTDPDCTDKSDFNRFCDQLHNIGYRLVAIIRERQPQAVIVGTSSLQPREIHASGCIPPDRRIDKTNPWEEIPRILGEIQK
jgi:CheY-like chemotaxis protein